MYISFFFFKLVWAKTKQQSRKSILAKSGCQPGGGRFSVWLNVSGQCSETRVEDFVFSDIMFCKLKHFFSSFLLPLSFCPPLTQVRGHWMVFSLRRGAWNKQLELVGSTLYWALRFFSFCINSFLKYHLNRLPAIMDLYWIAGSHLSNQVVLPGLLDILDNIIAPTRAPLHFYSTHCEWSANTHTYTWNLETGSLYA